MATDWTTLRRSESETSRDTLCTVQSPVALVVAAVAVHVVCLTSLRRKREGREPHSHSEKVRKLHGLK